MLPDPSNFDQPIIVGLHEPTDQGSLSELTFEAAMQLPLEAGDFLVPSEIILGPNLSEIAPLLFSEFSDPGGETTRESSEFSVQAFHHYGYFTEDPSVMADFYVEVLGFERMEMPPGDPATENGVVWVRIPGSGEELHFVPNTLKERLSGRLQRTFPVEPTDGDLIPDHIAIRVNDLEALRKRLVEHGVNILDFPRTTDTADSIYFEGPDGRVIEAIKPY